MVRDNSARGKLPLPTHFVLVSPSHCTLAEVNLQLAKLRERLESVHGSFDTGQVSSSRKWRPFAKWQATLCARLSKACGLASVRWQGDREQQRQLATKWLAQDRRACPISLCPLLNLGPLLFGAARLSVAVTLRGALVNSSAGLRARVLGEERKSASLLGAHKVGQECDMNVL